MCQPLTVRFLPPPPQGRVVVQQEQEATPPLPYRRSEAAFKLALKEKPKPSGFVGKGTRSVLGRPLSIGGRGNQEKHLERWLVGARTIS